MELKKNIEQIRQKKKPGPGWKITSLACMLVVPVVAISRMKNERNGLGFRDVDTKRGDRGAGKKEERRTRGKQEQNSQKNTQREEQGKDLYFFHPVCSTRGKISVVPA